MQVTCTRRLSWCSGHRVFGHEGKCRHLHGHNYAAKVTACADELDACGRVVDFSVLKTAVGSWIDQHWDHGFIVWEKDEEALRALRAVRGQKVFQLPWNPTAENLARYLLEQVCPVQLAGSRAAAVSVVVEETENCEAEVVR